MFEAIYRHQTELMLRCLPEVARQTCFALKGGTAINLFVHDLPRLSVDIDLAFLPRTERSEALREIDQSMLAIQHDIQDHLPGSNARITRDKNGIGKILVQLNNVQIKIEPNSVLRGSVYAEEKRDLCPTAQDEFEMAASIECLSVADLYGGKFCAALDRQHPRDLYDVFWLLKNGGITPEMRRAFIVYLAGNNRPMSELLNPVNKDLARDYEDQFVGMTRSEVPLEDLLQVQADLPAFLREGMKDEEKRFLMSMKEGDPDWDALGVDHLRELPALKWKLRNVRRMDSEKRFSALEKLRSVLGL